MDVTVVESFPGWPPQGGLYTEYTVYIIFCFWMNTFLARWCQTVLEVWLAGLMTEQEMRDLTQRFPSNCTKTKIDSWFAASLLFLLVNSHFSATGSSFLTAFHFVVQLRHTSAPSPDRQLRVSEGDEVFMRRRSRRRRRRGGWGELGASDWLNGRSRGGSLRHQRLWCSRRFGFSEENIKIKVLC